MTIYLNCFNISSSLQLMALSTAQCHRIDQQHRFTVKEQSFKPTINVMFDQINQQFVIITTLVLVACSYQTAQQRCLISSICSLIYIQVPEYIMLLYIIYN